MNKDSLSTNGLETYENMEVFHDFVYLVVCVIRGVQPDKERVKTMDLGALYRVASFHMMTAIVADALESAGVQDEAFLQAKAKAMRKDALLEIEQDAFFARMEAEGIWYAPLKGACLKEWYPATWMRQMTDVDIFFQPTARERVKEIAESLGFTVAAFGKGVHDCYQKPPVCEFEMHHALFYSSKNLGFDVAYFKKAEDRLLPDGNSRFGRRFSDEDFYIFMIAHDYKHYVSVGAGLRSLLDLYVFWRRTENSLDQEYVSAELQKLGIADFEKSCRELALCLFGGQEITSEGQKMLLYRFSSGARGNRKNLVKNNVTSYGRGTRAKLRYCLYRVFPPMTEIQKKHPFFYRHKILLPLMPFWRLLKGLFFHRAFLKNEVKEVFHTKE